MSECVVCKGTGKVGPFGTSMGSYDAIDRMTEREKDRFRIACPVCDGTCKASDEEPSHE